MEHHQIDTSKPLEIYPYYFKNKYDVDLLPDVEPMIIMPADSDLFLQWLTDQHVNTRDVFATR